MCNKAVGTYPSAMQFVPKCYKTRETSDKAIYTCAFVYDFFLIDIWLKKYVIKLFSKNVLC